MNENLTNASTELLWFTQGTHQALVSEPGVPMQHYSDYLRDQAVKYRELAEKTPDHFIKQEFLELAEVCEEVANKIDDRRASG